MTTLRDAAQQALEALESCDSQHPSDGGRQWYDDKLVEPAITALRAALAEPVQEPVAWMCPDDPQRLTAFSWHAGHCEDCGKQRTPLYAAPPQRKPLTDDRLWELWNIDSDEAYKNCPTYFQEFRYVARIVERAHGITGDNNE